MLRLLLSAALVLGLNFWASAQFAKGQIYLGGTTNLQLTSQFSPFSTALRAQVLESGVFLADRFLVGADVAAGVGTARGAVDGTSFFRPFARVYFLNQRPKHPTAFAELGVGSLGTDGVNQLDVRPAVGLDIPFAPQIFGSLKFQYTIVPNDNNVAQLSFGTNALLNQLGAYAGAQRVPVSQGQWMLDPQFGTLIYLRPSGVDTRLISGNIGTRGGYMFREALMFLGGISLSLSSNRSPFFEFTSNSVGADLGLRYLFPTARSTQFFAGGTVNVQRFSFRSSGRVGNSPANFSETNTAIMPELGLLFFLIDQLAIDPSVSLNIPLGDNNFESTLIRVGVGLQFFFGVREE